MASLGFRTTRLRGESHFYRADSALFSVAEQALAAFVLRVQGSLLKLMLLSLPRWRSHWFIVAGIQTDPKYAAQSRIVVSVSATLRKEIGRSSHN
jgi:hypothetical protein